MNNRNRLDPLVVFLAALAVVMAGYGLALLISAPFLDAEFGGYLGRKAAVIGLGMTVTGAGIAAAAAKSHNDDDDDRGS